MNSSYTHVVIYILLSVVGIGQSFANTYHPFYFDCAIDTLSLCVEDEDVRLPANNKIYLGEGHPDATSCSVHVSLSIKVRPECAGEVQYEVQLFLFNFGEPIILQSGASVLTDSLGEVELFFDSELSADASISQNGIPYTTGCERYHRIKWIVTDSCGQVNICDQLIDLYDCNPSLYAIIDGPLVFNYYISPYRTISLAELIDTIYDDCLTAEGFHFSFQQDTYRPDSVFYLCDLPALGIPLIYNFWIAVGGKDLDCNGTTEWAERNKISSQIALIFTEGGSGLCEPKEDYLYGEIKTEDIQSVTNVTVTLSSPGYIYPTYITAEDGKYNFYNLLDGEDYTIKAARNDWHRNGVSTLDLVRILKHLLGVESINSPYDLIAADANNSSSVSAIDLVELRKLILGIYTELPSNYSWRFVPKSFIFSDTTHPWPFDEEIEITVTNSQANLDFIAIKVGDVNNTVQANALSISPRNSPPLIKVRTPQNHYAKNEIIEIPITLSELKEIQGFQFTISSPDLEFVNVSSNTIDITDEHYSLFGEKITMSWLAMDGVAFDKDDVIFTLKAIAKKNGNLDSGFSINSEITEAEVYSMEDEIFLPQLIISEDAFGISTPMPNPWREKTHILVDLKEDGITEIKVLDLNGRLVYSEAKYLLKGKNEIVLESKNFEARGLMMYSIKSGSEVVTGKMIVLD